MARTRSWNPIAFVPAQVTIIVSAVYIALFSVLLWIHTDVPSAPRNPTPEQGLNLTQAWLDLDVLTDGFHPLDSRRNDYVRKYLEQRIVEILKDNHADYKTVYDVKSLGKDESDAAPAAATVFLDNTSNLTFADDWRQQPWSCYGESTSILVYIRGTGDRQDDWWTGDKRYDGQSGVLVNAHYDSVPSGFGATDDGVGVITVLQLISYFSTKGNAPRRGLVALLNNGEENGLFGAHEYARHPVSQLPHTFLNLEGAGAGGRAMLFRSTDTEVTRFYGQSRNPFGTVISADGFKRGFVRSGTDYSVLTNNLGMRGLDLAFYEPRSRYHTNQDDSRNTSPGSLWHMLSASLATVRAMTSYDGNEFEGDQDRTGRFRLSGGSEGVWFDMMGRLFAVAQLSTFFAVSVAMLVAGPILLIALELIVSRSGKWYPFSRRQYLRSSDDDEAIPLNGLRGFFRFPIAFAIATAAIVALAYLQTKINPYMIHSSEYAVWAMFLSAWFALAWFILAGADRVRPTALQRFHILLWVYVLTWALLVLATIGENNFKIGGGYFVVIYHASVLVAIIISYFELLALPTKVKYVEHVADMNIFEHDGDSIQHDGGSSRGLLGQSRDRGRSSRQADVDEHDDVTERTSLLRGGDDRSQNTFTGRGKKKRIDPAAVDESRDPFLNRAYGDEQPWSSSLPQWTWILQFLVLAPINIVIVGQAALVVTASLHQTFTNGSEVLPVYLMLATLSIALLLPVTPFLHRFSYKIPSFLFLIFAGCLVYNLLAFPFSRNARMEFYFTQRVDLDTGVNNVTITGARGFVRDAISELPSALGQSLQCGQSAETSKPGLESCLWHGIIPNVIPADVSTTSGLAPYRNHSKSHDGFRSWMNFNISSHGDTASFSIRGRETKQCRLQFDNPVSALHVADGAVDPRFESVPEDGSTQLTMLSRSWDKTFNVTVQWAGQEAANQTGRVSCMWNDANERGRIPAFDEASRFAPVWSVVVKGGDGLLEGWRTWNI